VIVGSIIILLRLFFLVVGQVPVKNVEVFVVEGAEGLQ